MLFGGLFSAYIFLRTGVDNWPAGTEYLDVRLATLNTLFLISSSVTMVMSWASLKLNDFKKFKFYSGTTLLFAFGFLVIKYFEYSAKFSHVPPYLPSTNNFLGIYVASIKASLVACYFMHLIDEKTTIYWTLIATAISFLILIFLPIGTMLAQARIY